MSGSGRHAPVMWIALAWAPVAVFVASARGWIPWSWGMGATAAVGVLGTAAVFARRERSGRDERNRVRAALEKIERAAEIGEGADEQERFAADAERDLGDAAEGVGDRVERASRRARARHDDLQAMLDALADPFLATDEMGVVRLANPSARAFFDGTRGGPVGRSIEDLFTQADALGLHAAARGGRAATGQVRLSRAGTPRIFEVAAAPVVLGPTESSDASGARGVALTLRDVTDLAAAIQLKAEFVANASHELRTPLASIKGAAETLRDGALDDPPMAARLVEMIATNVLRLEDLVRDLMELSRLESPDAPVRWEEVDLPRFARSIADLFADACRERRLTIEIEIAPDAAVIRTDRQLLQAILQNLVENATKFANEGTAVRIVGEALSPVRVMAPTVAASAGAALTTESNDIASSRPPGVRLRVIDRGIGIPINQQARIFDRFYQVDAARTTTAQRRGTGLGLAIVKHAVKRLGGSVGVESVWKQGTTMIVDLPGA